MTVRMRFTISGEYDADPANYESADPAAMAAEDQSNGDVFDVVEWAADGTLKVVIEPARRERAATL